MKKLLVLLFACGLTLQAQTWQSITSGLTGDIWGIDYVDANNIWICASNGGVARSTNGGAAWTTAGNAGDGAYSIAAIDANTAIVSLGPSSGNGKIMRTTNGGTLWSQVYTANTAWFNFIDNISSTLLWALSDPIGGNFHIVKSTDAGATWALAPNLPTQPANNVFGGNGSFYRIGNTCWWGTGGASGATLANRVYKSTNGPDGPWTFSSTTVQFVGTVAFSSPNGAGLSGHWQQNLLVNRTTNGGSSWTALTTGIGTVNGLDYIQTTPWAWAATSTGIHFTTNDGANWSQDLPEISMYVVRIFGDVNNALCGGAGGKLYKSLRSPVIPVELTSFVATTQDGKVFLNWKTATETNNYGFEVERMGKDKWEMIGFVPGSGNSNSPKDYSYVDKNLSGWSKFQYRLKQIDTDGAFEYSDVVEIEVVPNGYVLNQNYPNPFNPSTKISYSIPVASMVLLKVYDVVGNAITTLVNEQKEAGYYEATFDASKLSNGVYFCEMKAGNFRTIKKLVLMK